MTTSSEERISDLEIKLDQQDDLIDTLNQAIYRHQKKIDELESLCTALARHLKTVQESGNDGPAMNEKPPHY